jgi:hypothetical protein
MRFKNRDYKEGICRNKRAEPFLALPYEVVLGLRATLNSDHFYGNFKIAHDLFT